MASFLTVIYMKGDKFMSIKKEPIQNGDILLREYHFPPMLVRSLEISC